MQLKSLKSLIALPLVLIFCLSAQAGVPINGTDHLNKALEGFITRLEISIKAKIMPLLSNPADAPALEALWNVPAIIGTSPYYAADLPILMDVIQQQAQITKSYVLFTSDPAQEPDVSRNSTAFQNEISQSSVAMLRFIAASLEAATDFAANLKDDDSSKSQLAGLVQFRLAIQQVINSTVLMLHNSDLNTANQEHLALTLADNAQIIAQSMSLQERKTLITLMESAKPALNSAARLSAERFIKDMQNTECIGLCALN